MHEAPPSHPGQRVVQQRLHLLLLCQACPVLGRHARGIPRVHGAGASPCVPESKVWAAAVHQPLDKWHMPGLCGQHERGPTEVVPHYQRGPKLHERVCRAQLVPKRCECQATLSCVGSVVNVSPILHKKAQDAGGAPTLAACGLREGCLATGILLVDICPVLDQTLDLGPVALRGALHQGRPAARLDGVDVGPVVQKVVHHGEVRAAAHRADQRGAAGPVARVNVRSVVYQVAEDGSLLDEVAAPRLRQRGLHQGRRVPGVGPVDVRACVNQELHHPEVARAHHTREERRPLQDVQLVAQVSPLFQKQPQGVEASVVMCRHNERRAAVRLVSAGGGVCALPQ
mmetsp:Transcript_29828/g.93168  ORF Transcript_29828/g.93168 Transcript_29828/m.93168 type:complete len:342 (-) Transcript_29828:149-1174(-)